jgi:hypothetical protein
VIVITNDKVAGFEPRWAPYRGFSLLFDNPGASVSPMGEGLLKLACEPDTDPDLHLYQGLVDCLDKIDCDLLIRTYLFCPLPPASYHVTAWDGLNDGNVQQVAPQHRPDLEKFLDGLPGTLLAHAKFTAPAEGSPLVTGNAFAMRFTFKTLIKWRNRVLVARLKAADEDSERALARMVEERTRLCAGYGERFGVQMRTRYAPHVSLGYFANAECAELATPQIDRWTGLFQERVGGRTIAFNSISLYGFTDMATFVKK